MTLAPWKPSEKTEPSPEHRGEVDPSAIHTAVGQALSQFEHLESGLTRLFQLLCETPSFAACRAYGVVESPFTKAGMLRAAMEVFFARRVPLDAEYHSAMKALFAAYEVSHQYRNNIAHGMAVGFFLSDGTHSGYFLCPPSYATKKVAKVETYILGAAYWYNVEDIQHYSKRFTEMLGEAMRLIQEVNKKYAVLKDEQFHP
jgi:hypothetical protein